MFTKDDLKKGMLVVTKDGRKWIMLSTFSIKFIIDEHGNYESLSHFGIDLTHDELPWKYDVVKVYGNNHDCIINFDIKDRELLFESAPDVKTKDIKDGTLTVSINGKDNFIEFDEQGRITLVETSDYTLDKGVMDNYDEAIKKVKAIANDF